MKKIVFLLSISIACFIGCDRSNEVDLIIGDPDERVSDTLRYVKSTLVDAPHGWVAYTTTDLSGGYGFYFEFAENDRVKMVSDINGTTASDLRESTYRVRQIMSATLVFDSYTYITMLQDPTPGTLGGEAGAGFGSDIEYEYRRTSGDSLFFTGRRFKQELVLIKATSAEQEAYTGTGYLESIDKLNSFFVDTPYPYVEIAGEKVGISMNGNAALNSKNMSLTGLSPEGTAVQSGGKFAFLLDGAILLEDKLVYGGVMFVALKWKSETVPMLIDDQGREYEIESNPTPLIPLHIMIGGGYGSVVVPDASTYPGWSSDFINRRNSSVLGVGRWNIGGEYLVMQSMNFSFNANNGRMILQVSAPFGTNAFDLNYNYTYTKTAEGVFKFNYGGSQGGNENLIVGDLRYLMAERIDTDTFTVDYFINPDTGELLAQFTSIEHPDFYFTGLL